MLYRLKATNGKPIAKQALQAIRKRFKVYSNGRIHQHSEARRYLKFRQAKGCCFAQDTVFLCSQPSFSCVAEELIHAIQFKSGRYDYRVSLFGNAQAVLLCELEAASLYT